MNDRDAEAAAMDRFNNGEPVAPVDPLMIESWWDVVSSMPPEHRGHSAVGLGAVAGSKAAEYTPEQMTALLIRCTLLDSLANRRLLDSYLADCAHKKQMLAAIASVPFTRNDLIEAMADRIFREAPPVEAEKARAEMLQEGLNLESPKILARLITHVREHS